MYSTSGPVLFKYTGAVQCLVHVQGLRALHQCILAMASPRFVFGLYSVCIRFVFGLYSVCIRFVFGLYSVCISRIKQRLACSMYV